MIPTMTDSEGRESKTLAFVTWAYIILWLKFAVAGMTLPYIGTMPAMSALDFGVSVTAVLAIWLGHEWKKPTTGGTG